MYISRYIQGEVLQSTRQVITSDGAVIPTGSTSFEVAKGTVKTGEFIRFEGQNFEIVGITPIPPFYTRVALVADQVARRLPIQTVFGVAVDGQQLTLDGQRLVLDAG